MRHSDFVIRHSPASPRSPLMPALLEPLEPRLQFITTLPTGFADSLVTANLGDLAAGAHRRLTAAEVERLRQA